MVDRVSAIMSLLHRKKNVNFLRTFSDIKFKPRVYRLREENW